MKNVYRTQLGEGGLLRDPNNTSGGCGLPPVKKGCIIATTAYGSSLAPQVASA